MRARFDELMRSNGAFGMLAVGVDDFDRINSLYSYAFGDLVLGELAALLDGLLPDDAELFRFDGDCFGAIVPGIVDARELQALFGRVLERTTAGFLLEGSVMSFRVSGGICLCPGDGRGADELYRGLHIALVDAKRGGRGRCTVCSSELCSTSRKALLLMETLQSCVAQGFQGFSVHYQPIVDARAGSVHGCEALMRWRSELFPEGVSPFEFIPYLEESGLIDAATSWLMDEAFEKTALWTRANPSFVMNVNLSKYVLDDPSFKFRIVQAAKDHRADPRNIMLELTESGMITDAEGLGDTFDFLRSQGFGVAFDDFGTGYASLNLFRVIAADELKVDRSFLERITYDVNDQCIVSSIIDLCHRMNLTVCVEGVESEKTLDLVRTLGADYIQGFYYDRPLRAEAFEERYLGADGRARSEGSGGSLVYGRARPVQPLSPDQLIDYAHAGVFQVAMDDDFTFISCNEGYRRMLGYTALQIATKLGNRALAIVHPDDTDFVNEEIRRQLGLGDTVLSELRIVRADGSTLWVTGTGNVVRPKTGMPYLVVIIVDTDRLKRAALETAERLALADAVLRDAPSAIMRLRADEPLAVEYLSDELLSIIGYSRDEVRDRFGDRFGGLVHPEDVAPALAAVQAAKPGQPFKLRYRLRASDGRLLRLDALSRLSEPDESGACSFVSIVTAVEAPSAHSAGLLLDNRYQMASKRWGDVLFNLYIGSDVIEFTDNYADELGAPPKATIAEQLALSPEPDRSTIAEGLEQAKRGEVPAPIEMRVSPKGDGNHLWCSLSFNCAETLEGEPVTIFGRIRNIDAEKRERDELVRDSRNDPLCGVLNKITIENVVEDLLGAAGPEDRFAFAIVDIDDFKGVNDRDGHFAGDCVLVSVADALKELAGEEGLVGRIGGDEFVVVRPFEPGALDPLGLGEGVIGRIAALCRERGQAAHLRASAGIACFPDDGRAFYDLYKHADAALYLAKERGKDRACLYSERPRPSG